MAYDLNIIISKDNELHHHKRKSDVMALNISDPLLVLFYLLF